MPTRKITARNTKGYNAIGFVAKDVEYNPAANATYLDFVEKAPIGTVGIFKLVSGDETKATRVSTALADGDKFFIAQVMLDRREQFEGVQHVKKTPTFDYKDLTKKGSAGFVLPVKQVTAVGFDGTKGDLVADGGTLSKYDDVEIAIIDLTVADLSYPTWNFNVNAKAGETIKSAAYKLVNKVNDPLDLQNKEFGSIVSAEVLVAGTATAETPTFDVVNGEVTVEASAAPVVTAGGELRLGGATGGTYLVESVVGTTVTLSSPFAGKTATGLAGDIMTATTHLGIRFTSIYEGSHFRVAVKGEITDSDVSYITPFSIGSGGRTEVERLEYEANIFEGVTTVNAAFKERYGELTTFRSSALAYDVIRLQYRKASISKAIVNSEDVHYGYVDFAAPITTGAPASEGFVDATASPLAIVKTALGV